MSSLRCSWRGADVSAPALAAAPPPTLIIQSPLTALKSSYDWLWNGNFAVARKELTAFLPTAKSTHPKYVVELYRFLTFVCFELGDHPAAIEMANEGLELAPQATAKGEMMVLRAFALQRTRNFTAAVKEAEALAEGPFSYEANLVLSWSYFELGKTDLALKAAEAAIADTDGQARRTRFKFHRGNMSPAQLELLQAHRQPVYPMIVRAAITSSKGNHELAAKYHEETWDLFKKLTSKYERDKEDSTSPNGRGRAPLALKALNEPSADAMYLRGMNYFRMKKDTPRRSPG